MRQSNLYVYTKKEVPSDCEIISHELLVRGGYVKQVGSGVYTFMPLGLKVLRNIENIVREELDALGYNEILMPVLQPKALWDESGRWEDYGDNLFRVLDRHQKTFALGPTHEEVITAMIRDEIKSYKVLPFGLYQIQTKFRDEFRPRFGLMRSREFLMKDLYTFHDSIESLDQHYDKISDAYSRIFTRLGVDFIRVEADNGDIGGSGSHEFMALSSIGEDTITFCRSCGYNANVEKSGLEIGDACPVCSKPIDVKKGIELGHIFKLGTKYSEAMKAYVNDASGRQIPIIMGCYGIGISRCIMALLEQSKDGIVNWNDEVAPFSDHIIIANVNDENTVNAANEYYQRLLSAGKRVLIDDRNERIGSKLKDSELIGACRRIVFGKDFVDGKVEFIENNEKTLKEFKLL